MQFNFITTKLLKSNANSYSIANHFEM